MIFADIKKRITPARLFIAAFSTLAVWGAFVLWSVDIYQSKLHSISITPFLFRHLVFVWIGIVGIVVSRRIDLTRTIARIPWWLWCGMSLLLTRELYHFLDKEHSFRPIYIPLAVLFDLVDGRNAAWLAGMFNPAILASLFFGCGLISWSQNRLQANDGMEDQRNISGIIISIAAIIMTIWLGSCADYSAMLLFVYICVAASWVSGKRLHAALFGSGFMLTQTALIVMRPHLLARMEKWFNGSDYEGISYHPLEMRHAFYNGGMFGNGPFSGLSEMNFIPESHSSSTASVIATEYGLTGFIVCIALWILVSYLCLKAMKVEKRTEVESTFGLLHLTSAITFCAVFSHFLFNTIISPLARFPLPLFSQSGLFTVIALLMIGLAYKSLRNESWESIAICKLALRSIIIAGVICSSIVARAIYITFDELPVYRTVAENRQMYASVAGKYWQRWR